MKYCLEIPYSDKPNSFQSSYLENIHIFIYFFYQQEFEK